MDPSTDRAMAVEAPAARAVLTTADVCFLAFLVGILAVVAWVGKIAYAEGEKVEVAKANGEAWVRQLAETGRSRFAAGYRPGACAASPAVAGAAASKGEERSNDRWHPPEQTWGECRVALSGPQGTLGQLTNPFSSTRQTITQRCDPSNPSSRGAIVLERLEPTAPGSPASVAAVTFSDSDSIGRKIQLRLSICDKGGYAIRVGEIEF